MQGSDCLSFDICLKEKLNVKIKTLTWLLTRQTG